MTQRGQAAFVGGADLDVLLLLLAVTAGGEHLLPGQHQFDRTPHPSCGHGGQRDVRPDRPLATEPATDETGEDPHLRPRDAQVLGDRGLGGHDALRGVVEGEPVAVPHRGGGRRLDRVVVVGGEAERRGEPGGGGGETGVDIAARTAPGDEAGEDRLRFVGLAAAFVQGGRRRTPLIVDSACPSSSSATADMIWPGVQYPHWKASCSQNARCIGCGSSPSASPSIVVTSRPSHVIASVRQASTLRPSTHTVQAPQVPWSQPFLEPVRSRCSRSASSRLTRGSSATTRPFPFTERFTLAASGPRVTVGASATDDSPRRSGTVFSSHQKSLVRALSAHRAPATGGARPLSGSGLWSDGEKPVPVPSATVTASARPRCPTVGGPRGRKGGGPGGSG